MRNQVAARVSRAAASVGANEAASALADLDYVEKRLRDPAQLAALQWPHSTPERVGRAYRLITNGLRASANRELGHLDAEAEAILARRAILEEKLGESSRSEVARQEMLTEVQLAVNASQRHDAAAAGQWLGRALTRADDLRARAHGVSDKDQLDVLWLAAELTVSMGTTLVADLPKRITAASAELAARREPALQRYARWFEVYGAMAR